jgi:cytochrome c oxidase cbb3-type subunit I/II
MSEQPTLIRYNDGVVRQFLIATVVWGIVGMLVGVIIGLQLNYTIPGLKWAVDFGEGFLSYGRLRPLHTNAVIFAFVGNMVFAGVYYSTQRLCKCRMASDLLSQINFWGWQLIIVAAAVTLPMGLTQSKEYAELIWPIDLAVVLVWVAFGANFFWTLARRNEPSLYVALWFYIATIITVAMLYIVNNLHIPTSLVHSYPIFGGAQDALVQWWYGHNAVAFFLTTPVLGIMYYYLPKAAARPVYSYRLSIVHFWSLVFIYIWAGPHHLLNTSLPHWLQGLGMLFSLMLWAPSWGGMLNGLLTLRGAWHKLRTDPVLKFFIAGVTFYGMATFEGPLLSVRAVNAISHYTDWGIGHVHSGALGWNGFMAAGMIYWLLPRLWRGKDGGGNPDSGGMSCAGLWSPALANLHFWLGLVGILLYVGAMWAAGITQYINLGQVEADGVTLARSFVETVEIIAPLMLFRVIGGLLYLVGFVLLAVNLVMTVRGKVPSDGTVEVMVRGEKTYDRAPWWGAAFRNDPVAHLLLGIFFFSLWFILPKHANMAAFAMGCVVSVRAVLKFRQDKEQWVNWHERLLENWVPFTVLAFVAVAVGGVIQIVPTVMLNRAENVKDRLQEVYTPLELLGRDIYVSEGCYNCHSQQIRMLEHDVMRYGDYSRLGESIFDHPFQWGSKRTGPDLARAGGMRSDEWHFQHMYDPRMGGSNAGSRMPRHPWLFVKEADIKSLPARLAAQVRIGVPFKEEFPEFWDGSGRGYPIMRPDEITNHAMDQALEIARGLVKPETPEAGVTLPARVLVDLGRQLVRSDAGAARATLAEGVQGRVEWLSVQLEEAESEGDLDEVEIIRAERTEVSSWLDEDPERLSAGALALIGQARASDPNVAVAYLADRQIVALIAYLQKLGSYRVPGEREETGAGELTIAD